MSCDISATLRHVIDISNGVNNSLGLNAYTTILVMVTTTPVDVYGEGGTKTISEMPLLVGPLKDGYVNLEQVKSKDIFLSGGVLTEKDYKLGPIVLPYITCEDGYEAGLDIILTNPQLTFGTNTEFYFKISGPDFPIPCYFKRIWDRADNNVCYYVYVRNIGVKLI